MPIKDRAVIVVFMVLGLAAPASVALAQAAAHYAYDAQGRLVSSTRPSGPTTTYTYDAANNRSRVQITSAPPPPTNQAPVCANKTVDMGSIPNGGAGVSTSINPMAVTPACTDPDGDALTLVSVSGFTNQASGSVVSSTTASITNILAGGTTFIFAVSDGRGHTIYPTFTFLRQ